MFIEAAPAACDDAATAGEVGDDAVELDSAAVAEASAETVRGAGLDAGDEATAVKVIAVGGGTRGRGSGGDGTNEASLRMGLKASEHAKISVQGGFSARYSRGNSRG